VTLELPEMITKELVEVEIEATRKAEEKAKKKEERRKRYLKNKR
jgi:ribosome biogenesis GTPase A